MDLSINVNNLYKQFGDQLVVDNISLQLSPGEVLGFLGPNGAGKSTTMRIITGYLEASEGSVNICGHDMQTDPIAAKSYIGYLPEGSPLYSDMTAAQFLRFVATVRGLKGNVLDERIAWVVETLHLQQVLTKGLDTLSKGFKRRVGLAQALIHDPNVLVLDEPTDGLDPIQKQEVRELITSLATSKAIIISTHILEEVEPVCTRAMIISKGATIFDGTPKQLLRLSPEFNQVYVRLLTNNPSQVATDFRGIRSVSSVSYKDDGNGYFQFRVAPESSEDLLQPIGDLCFHKQWKLAGLSKEQCSLENVFQQLASSNE